MRFVKTHNNGFLGRFAYQQVVPQDSFLRKLRDLIDWDRFVAMYVGMAEHGRPPYHPVLVFKCLLLAYLYNRAADSVHTAANVNNGKDRTRQEQGLPSVDPDATVVHRGRSAKPPGSGRSQRGRSAPIARFTWLSAIGRSFRGPRSQVAAGLSRRGTNHKREMGWVDVPGTSSTNSGHVGGNATKDEDAVVSQT